jgi:cytidylate kinase
MGSQGFEVAEKAATLLGYNLIGREIINRAAVKAGAPEMALAVMDELGLLNICPSTEACSAYIAMVNQVVPELISHGKVILLGRAGQVILRDHPGVFHVRIIAPFETRVERITAQCEISNEAACARIIASDRARKKYLKKFYQANWEDPLLYDLVINTKNLTSDQAAWLVIQACMQQGNFVSHQI